MKENKNVFAVSLYQLYPALLFFICIFFCVCYGNPQYAGGYDGSTDVPAFIEIVWMPLVFGTLALCAIFAETLFSGKLLSSIALGLNVALLGAVIAAISEYFLDLGTVDNDVFLPRMIAVLLLFVLVGIAIGLNAKRFSEGRPFAESEEWKKDFLVFFGAMLSSVILELFVLSVFKTTGLEDGTSWSFLIVSIAIASVLALYALYCLFGKKAFSLAEATRKLMLCSIIACVAPFIALFASANSLEVTTTYQNYYWATFVYAAATILSFAAIAYFAYREKRYS